MTSDLLKCQYCLQKYAREEIVECQNCSRIACADCVEQAENDDLRDCNCDHLCEVCRSGPTECKGCKTKGCALCMGAGCKKCNESERHGVDLICEDCRESCNACSNQFCGDHIYRCVGGDDSDDESRHYKICTGCINDNFNIKRKKSRCSENSSSSTSKEELTTGETK